MFNAFAFFFFKIFFFCNRHLRAVNASTSFLEHKENRRWRARIRFGSRESEASCWVGVSLRSLPA